MLYCAKIIEETDLKRRRMKSEDRKMKEPTQEISEYETLKQILNDNDTAVLYHIEIVLSPKEGGRAG